ncbi:MAG: putative lipid II flippase FtsW [Actinomycetia bacterium]|nr:putative lipid II flippase FtsW [Actinomycetes bacterium]
MADPKSARRPGRNDSTRTRKGDSRAKAPRRPKANGWHRPEETVLRWAVLLLCGLSVVMVYSASSVYAQREFGSTWSVLARHLTYVAIGLVVLFGASRIPLRVWRDRLTPLLLVAAFASLAVLLVPGMPFAPEVNGATRWIRVGPLGFQPSDLAKLAMVLWLARLLSIHRKELGEAALLKSALFVFVPLAALVLAGDDLGTTMLLGIVFVTMWFLAGAPLQQVTLLGGGLAGVGLLGLFMLEGFRTQRVLAFLSPEQYADGAGYQALQSQIGFASGGLWGQGPGASKGKWGFLPEAHTDFILAVIGEELGLIGSIVIIAALAAVVASGFVIGMRCRDFFGRLVSFGISTWFGVQAVINIGVAVGAMPTKGIPLPFVSYGGTAMVMSLLGVGVLMAVSRTGSQPAVVADLRRGAERRRPPRATR